jgi:hypothetical protein
VRISPVIVRQLKSNYRTLQPFSLGGCPVVRQSDSCRARIGVLIQSIFKGNIKTLREGIVPRTVGLSDKLYTARVSESGSC